MSYEISVLVFMLWRSSIITYQIYLYFCLVDLLNVTLNLFGSIYLAHYYPDSLLLQLYSSFYTF